MSQVTSNIAISARKAVLSDVPEIAAVHIKAWNEAMRPLKVFSDEHIDSVNSKRLQQHTDGIKADEEGRVYIVAIATDSTTNLSKVVGLCVMGDCRVLEEFSEYSLQLIALYVDSAYYGTGAAQKMIAEGIRCVKSTGKMLCEALEANKRACRFYEKIGGKIIGHKVTTKYGGFETTVVTFGWDSAPLSL
ncbi:UNVERIFIED_CONTAM: hypothetical protein HDU68_012438 [Siphonaria sp. JEL0065]|nr:hypothetical protein HDU68_012438 [Siphonaria sp. JEL0065]